MVARVEQDNDAGGNNQCEPPPFRPRLASCPVRAEPTVARIPRIFGTIGILGIRGISELLDAP
jgi:hypothetical protein